MIRNQYILPKRTQQKPADLSGFILPPITPQTSKLQLREIGSGFQGLEVQPQTRRRVAVRKRKEKRRVTNKQFAPLGLTIAKPLRHHPTENPQQASSSLASPFRTSGDDNTGIPDDPGSNILDDGINQQDFLSSGNRNAHIDKPKSPNSVEGKRNRSGEIEGSNRIPRVSAPLRVLSGEQSLQSLDQPGIAMKRDYGTFLPNEGGGIEDRNTCDYIFSGTRSHVKGSDQDHRTGTVRRVSFLRELPNGRLESMQRIKAELVEKVLKSILSSDLLKNPWVDCYNGKEPTKDPRTGSLEISTKSHPAVQESEKFSGTEWRVTSPYTRGRSIELEDKMLDCGSPTLTDHSYCRRQHDSIYLDNPLPNSMATRGHQDSVMSLSPRKTGRRITLEIPETQKSTSDQYVRQDQGLSSVIAVSNRGL